MLGKGERPKKKENLNLTLCIVSSLTLRYMEDSYEDGVRFFFFHSKKTESMIQQLKIILVQKLQLKV